MTDTLCEHCGMDPLDRRGEGEWCPVCSPPRTCQLPPSGWYCTREAGHDGSCAARPVSPEAAPPRATTPDDELAEKARRVISDMCKGDRWRMCIPVQPDDSDVILGTLVKRFNELRASLSAAPSEEIGGLLDAWAEAYAEMCNMGTEANGVAAVEARMALDKALAALQARSSVDAREAERLRAENAELETRVAEAERWQVVEQSHVATLEARLAESESRASADAREAERLRWLSAGNRCESTPDGYLVWSGETDKWYSGPTLSDAIDCARPRQRPRHRRRSRD